jgi:hypothetical protein
MSREIMQQALDAISAARESELLHSKPFQNRYLDIIGKLEAELAKPNDFYPDWDMLKPYHERIAELEAQLAQPEMPTKIFGPNLEQILNAAGFYRREWVGLTGTEINHIFAANVGYPERMCHAIEAKLKEKNNAV